MIQGSDLRGGRGPTIGGEDRDPGGAPSSARQEPRRRRIVPFLRAVGDFAAVALAFTIVYRLYQLTAGAGYLPRPVPRDAAHAGLGLLFGSGVVLFGLLTRAYGSGSSVLQFRETRAALRAVWLTAAFLFAALFLAKLGAEFSRILLTGSVLLSAGLIVLERRAMAPVVARLQQGGNRIFRVVIVGAGGTGRLLMKKIVQAPATGLSLAGFIDDRMPVGSRITCRLRQGEPDEFEARVLGRTWDLCDVYRANRFDGLLLALGDLPNEAVDAASRQAKELGLEIGFVPGLGDLRVDQLEVHDLAAIPILRPSRVRSYRLFESTKRILDVVIGSLLLVVLLPLWIAAALAIRLDSGSPVLFRQVRVGRDGNPFVMAKFRTMRTDTDPFAESPSSASDPRVTRVGRWLRALGLDEIPQLLNVLRGDMSLVGPRPEMPFLVEQYTERQRIRLRAKPGITGLWQLSPDRGVHIHDNLEYDIYYVSNLSPLLDLLILLETAVFTVAILGRRLFGTERRRKRKAVASRPAVAETAGPGRECFLLVALDQRVRDGGISRWEPFVSSAREAADGRTVKILVAPRNLPAMTRLVDAQRRLAATLDSETRGRAGAPRDSDAGPKGSHPHRERTGMALELVPCRGFDEMTRWADAAGVVLTDLAIVRDRVTTMTTNPVVYVDEHGRAFAEGAGDGSADVVSELMELLATRDVPSSPTVHRA
jgi:exopolysaccharide biosynthesis polyprenyl glycosylphosphotransferase